jgi:hypothetical protein
MKVVRPKPSTTASQITGLRDLLDTGGKAVLVAYGVGFFIESYFDAQHGLTYMNPLRSRIAVTGISFLMQIAFVLIIFHAEDIVSTSSVFWRGEQFRDSGVPRTITRSAFVASWMMDVAVVACFVMLTLTDQVTSALDFTGTSVPGGTPSVEGPHTVTFGSLQFGWDSVLLAVAFLIARISAQLAQAAPALRLYWAALCSLSTLVLFVAMATWHATSFFIFCTYVGGIRAITALYRANKGRQEQYLRLALAVILLALPCYYSEFVYEKISPWWGGAAQAELWIRFKHDMVPFGVYSPAILLEETDEGYYLLQKRSVAGKNADISDSSAASTPSDEQESDDKDSAETKPSVVPGKIPKPPNVNFEESVTYIPRKEIDQVIYVRGRKH